MTLSFNPEVSKCQVKPPAGAAGQHGHPQLRAWYV